LRHSQYSVFSVDITEAQAIKLRHELSLLMIHGDRVVEITTANRHNVTVMYLSKDESGKGEVKRKESTSHCSDFEVM